MGEYKKRIEELTIEINTRSDRLQKFVAQNAQKIEEEKALIQQKIGAVQELSKLDKEAKPKKDIKKDDKQRKP